MISDFQFPIETQKLPEKSGGFDHFKNCHPRMKK